MTLTAPGQLWHVRIKANGQAYTCHRTAKTPEAAAFYASALIEEPMLFAAVEESVAENFYLSLIHI